MGVGEKLHVPVALLPGKSRYPLSGLQGRSGRVRKIFSNRDSIPDRPARSESLYRLSYPGPWKTAITKLKHRCKMCAFCWFLLYMICIKYLLQRDSENQLKSKSLQRVATTLSLLVLLQEKHTWQHIVKTWYGNFMCIPSEAHIFYTRALSESVYLTELVSKLRI
jgi:hypothetical protein